MSICQQRWGRKEPFCKDNTQPQLATCYYPEHWPESRWASDAELMRSLGIRWVRVGEFSWSRLEPSRGDLQFDWLERAINTLGAAGLGVILGTPTATPPKWLVDSIADMLAHGADDNPRTFGSRRHYCFSSQAYRDECTRIVGALAERFGNNPHVHFWQTDNEYGCHDTTRSYSPAALAAFRAWLEQRYGSIDKLNAAWGNVFWSMEYYDFAAVELPNQCVTEANPAHWLDFYRFSSEQVRSFNALQTNILRAYHKPILHNYMGFSLDFDHYQLGADLDIATWDSYPIGFLQAHTAQKPDPALTPFDRQGDPDFQALHHDLYRSVGRGRWWVMEQQPGPVNWSAWNPKPLPGMVQLWGAEAFAHGAEVVSYFRWRQLPFAQEQMHTGLLQHDGELATGGVEVGALHAALAKLPPWPPTTPAEVAIVFDYQSHWAWRIQPQGQDFDYFALVYSFYRALRDLAQSVDIVPATSTNFADYQLLLVPALFSWPTTLNAALQNYSGTVLLGPRCGHHDDNFRLRPRPPWRADKLDIKITTCESLPPSLQIACASGYFERWFEYLELGTTASAALECAQGVALAQQGRWRYLAGWGDHRLLKSILKSLLLEANIASFDLPRQLRCRQRDNWRFWFNYGNSSVKLPHTPKRLLHGSNPLPSAAWAIEKLN